MYEHDEAIKRWDTCTCCGTYKPGDIEKRFSFGAYAGLLCTECARKYADHCGLDGHEQGDPSRLDEPYFEEEGIRWTNTWK